MLAVAAVSNPSSTNKLLIGLLLHGVIIEDELNMKTER
jgi:hypothetical protein